MDPVCIVLDLEMNNRLILCIIIIICLRESCNQLPTNQSGQNTPETANNASSHRRIGTGGTVALGVIVGLLVLGLIGFIGIWMFKRKKKSRRTFDDHVVPASLGSSPRSGNALLECRSLILKN